MNAQRWQKIKRLFDAAVEIDADGRGDFLANACAGDNELRDEVDKMLGSFESSESFLESPAAEAVADQILDSNAKLAAGQIIGRYEIIRQIGEGGMGEVYLAVDEQLDRQVAVKVLNREFSRNESNLDRFIREARSASALNHPNILVIHEIGDADDSKYIVSEFVDGKTLREWLDGAPTKVSDLLDIAIQIASAMTAAHGANIVHRDLKPENIMIRPDGYVKILDFGLAKLIQQTPVGLEDATAKQNQTAKGIILGTVNYMSPEQAKGQQVDARTDIFSFGVVFYEMIAGQTPFAGDSSSESFANLINSEPQPLSRYSSNVPDELQRIVRKTLRKDKDDRYQTMKGLLADLKTLRKRLDFETELRTSDRSDKREPRGIPASVNEATSGNSQFEASDTGTLLQTPTHPNIATQTDQSTDRLIPKQKSRLSWLLVGLSSLLIVFGGFLGYRSYMKDAGTQIESIAVLPFVNESGNNDVEYLSDGMTEMLINSLAQLPGLSVKARSSVFHYKGKEVDAQQVAAALSVQAILTGRVVQRGDNLTLSLELVDARTGNQLWGEQYNRKVADLVALQSEIARDVSEKLRLRLTSTEQQRLTKRGTENIEAYQAYLKGRYYWNKGLAPGYEKSREYFQQAIDLDPTYARAYSGLADYYGFASASGLLPPNEGWPKAEAAANKALALDDTLAETYNPLAAVKLYYYRDWPAAERYFRRGIELNPNYAEIHLHYAVCLVNFGRGAEALAEVQHAVELDPLSLRANLYLAIALFSMRQYDRAIDQFRKTLELDPNFAIGHEWFGDAYEQKGMYGEAITEWGKALTLNGAGEQASSLERAYAASGFETAVRARAQQRLEKLNERMKRGEYVPAFEYVTAYTRLGDKEQAFAWLDKAVQERNGFWLQIKVNPIYDKLREDQRFQDLMQREGYSQ